MYHKYRFCHGLRTPKKPVFFKIPKIGLGQTIWAGKFWDIFKQFISIHFGTVSPLSMFSINQPLFLQKTKPLLHTNPWDWDLNLDRKELGI